MVVAFQSIVPSASGASVGTVNTSTSSRSIGIFEPVMIALRHLANLVLDDGLEDFPAVALSLDERLGEFPCLIGADLARQRRLVRIDDRFDNRRARMRERLSEDRTDLGRIVHGEAAGAA